MEELKRLRRARGLSQAKLAALADLDPSTVSQIETGARRANSRTLERIAAALGVEVRELFPLGQAPLPDFEDERRESVYEPWLEFVNRYADRWEQRIANGAFDVGAVYEFVATLEDVGPVLSRLGLQEKQEQPDDYISSFGPIMGEAVSRLAGLAHPLIEAGTKKFEESELEQLRRRRESIEQWGRAASG